MAGREDLPSPVGYLRLHRSRFVNYQLNRLRSLGGLEAADLAAVGERSRSFDDCRRELAALGDRLVAQQRLREAAFAYRGAEFFAVPGDPRKTALYERFLATFDEAYADLGFARDEVAHDGGALPLLRLAADGPSRGTVLVHGGFDSFIEEWIVVLDRLARAGYDAVGFEGPGQGAALRHHGLTFDHDWEKPTGAVLDHLGATDVTLVGISMGGYWCLRAAAFEPRVRRVVVWASVYDWLAQLPAFARPLVPAMVRRRRFMNASIRLRTRLVPVLRHAVAQALLQIDEDEPVAAAEWLLAMNAAHQHPERVTQDVLLLHGADDRFQPLSLHRAQRAALTRAASVTERIFTAEEHAASHCQMGNIGLAVDVITAWLDDRVPAQQA